MKIDAHQHFWKFDPVRDAWISDQMGVLRRDFLPSDLWPILQKNGIAGCVAVQADQSEKETRFLLDQASQHPFIKAVVGWVDLRSPNLLHHLEQWSDQPKLKGFRHILQGEMPEFMLQSTFLNGLRQIGTLGYAYDLLVFPRHLNALKKLLKSLDNQFFIIDHLAKPYIKRGLIKQWRQDMMRIAQHEQVYCKVSGLVTEAEWTAWKTTDLEPYLETVLESFGAKRLIYGSDWPVCLLASGYERQLNVLDQFVKKLSPAEQAGIMGLNAMRFYQISEL